MHHMITFEIQFIFFSSNNNKNNDISFLFYIY